MDKWASLRSSLSLADGHEPSATSSQLMSPALQTRTQQVTRTSMHKKKIKKHAIGLHACIIMFDKFSQNFYYYYIFFIIFDSLRLYHLNLWKEPKKNKQPSKEVFSTRLTPNRAPFPTLSLHYRLALIEELRWRRGGRRVDKPCLDWHVLGANRFQLQQVAVTPRQMWTN